MDDQHPELDGTIDSLYKATRYDRDRLRQTILNGEVDGDYEWTTPGVWEVLYALEGVVREFEKVFAEQREALG